MKFPIFGFRLITYNFLWGVVFFIFFVVVFISGKTLANTSCSDPASGGIRCGAFVPWLQSVLVDQEISLSAEINPTVKYAKQLVDEYNTGVMFAKNGKVGIGTNDPKEILEVSGNTPVVNIRDTAIGSSPTLQIVSSGKTATLSVTKDAFQKNIWKATHDKSSVIVDESGKVDFSHYLKINNDYVIRADICPEGYYIKQILSDGYITCTNPYL